jgi:hypothetical protein
MSDKNQKSEVFIRSDGWVFSKDGMDKLVAGGHKGFNRFKENTEAKIGKWHRVSKPLDQEAAAAVMEVKGMVSRAMFVSSAILAEAERRAKNQPKVDIPQKGRGVRGKFMRLTLTEDAFWTVCKMENAEFREFVSKAILRAAKRRK